MDNIILWIMAIAMVLGALDRMFGSRLGLGKQFEEGILAIGAAARAGRPDVPVDAAIVAILDETEATHG